MLAACGGSVDDTIKVDSIMPAYASLNGGSHIVIKGQGFLRDGAAPNHVVVGTTEAPLAAASDDQTLEVDVPPGDKAGDVAVTVFNRNGTVTAMGMLKYSAAPSITTVSPSNVLYNSTTTTITVSGSGFQDESAGVPVVTVDGQPVVDVKVVNDTTLTFTSRTDVPFVQPTLEIDNARGTAKKLRAYRLIPSTQPGLIAFARLPNIYAFFYDPVANTTLTIPATRGRSDHVRGSYYDAEGTLWALISGPLQQGFGGRANMQLGKLDFSTQSLSDAVSIDPTTAPTTVVPFQNMLYTYDRNNGNFSSLDPATGILTPIGPPLPNYSGQSLVVNNGVMYLINGGGVSTITPSTGVRGTIFALNPNHVTVEARFLGNTLYGVDNSGQLFTIDPTNGVTVNVHSFPAPTSAIEVFTP